MIVLAFKNFVRSSGVRVGLLFLLMAGMASLLVGKQFRQRQEKTISEVGHFQKKDFRQNAAVHHDDLGLLLYYLKFSLVNPAKWIIHRSAGRQRIGSARDDSSAGGPEIRR